MILTNETDYAIRIVTYLSEHNRKVDAGTIAKSTGVTPRFTLKILRRLMEAGIVRSYKGAQGGYALAKAPQEITMLEVVETICGPLAVNRCQHDPGECTHPNGVCCYRDVFSDVSRYMRQKFKSVTFKRDE